MSKVKTNPVGYLSVQMQAITQAYTNYSAKSDEKRTERLTAAIQDYLTDLNDFIGQGAIACDPYGVVAKTNVPEGIAHQIIDKIVQSSEHISLSILQMKEAMNHVSSPEVLDNVTFMDRFRKSKTKAKGMMSNGVKWLFDGETGKLTLLYGKFKRCLVAIKDSAVFCWNYIVGKVKEFFSACKAKLSGSKEGNSGCELQSANA